MPKLIHQDPDITDLEHLVGIIEKTSKTELMAAERAWTVRVPVWLAAKVDAMAEHAGVTRNALSVELLEFAADEVFGQLSAKTGKAVKEVERRLLQEYIEEASK